MAINVRCPGCRSDIARKHSVCPKCKTTVPKIKKYKVIIKTPDGNRISRVVDGNLALAKKVEAKLKTEIAEKRFLGIEKAKLIDDVWKDYLDWSKTNKKSWRDDESRWNKHVARHVKSKKMDSLTTVDVEKILSAMNETFNPKSPTGKGYKPATVNNVLTLLKSFYNWSKVRSIYSGANPCDNVKVPKFDNRTTRYLTKDQMISLIKTVDTWPNRRAGLLVKFALNTGMRQGEITALEWRDIDKDKGFVTIRDPKGVVVNTLPLSDTAQSILKEADGLMPTKDCLYCFPNRKGQMRTGFWKNWMRIRDKAGLPKEFRFHDLRHTFASYLASSGRVDLYTLQNLMTHKSSQMTQRYAHLLDEALRRGADVAGEVLNGK